MLVLALAVIVYWLSKMLRAWKRGISSNERTHSDQRLNSDTTTSSDSSTSSDSTDSSTTTTGSSTARSRRTSPKSRAATRRTVEDPDSCSELETVANMFDVIKKKIESENETVLSTSGTWEAVIVFKGIDETRTKTETGKKTETDLKTGTGTKTETDPKTDSETRTETDPRTDSETRTETDPKTDSEARGKLDSTKLSFDFFPRKFKYPKLYEAYTEAKQTIWYSENIDLTDHKRDFDGLSIGEQKLIKMILVFFASADEQVNDNIMFELMPELEKALGAPEVMSFYKYQMFIEEEHSVVYSKLLNGIVDEREEERLRDSSRLTETERKMCMKMAHFNGIDQTRLGWRKKVILMAAQEGIGFQASFAYIYWYKNRNLLHGLTQSNEFICRDELMHRDYGCLLVRETGALSPAEARFALDVVEEMVCVEKEFYSILRDDVDCSRDCPLSYDSICEYIEFVADNFLIELGLGPLYRTPNPLPHMHKFSVQRFGNFFEGHGSEWDRAVDDYFDN